MQNAKASLGLGGAVVLALATVVRLAQAHAVGLSSGEYTVTGAEVVARLVFAQADAEGLDADTLVREIVVSSDGKACNGVADEVVTAQPPGMAYRARFVCDPPRQRIVVRATFFDRLPEGHRHAIRLQQGARSVGDVLYRRHDSVAFAVDSAPSPPRPIALAAMGGLLRMGLEHILTGYDHLLFLFGLVLVAGSVRSLLAVVTAFTIAHSITLGTAALGVWAPATRIVEPGIALSIVYVGVENFFIADIRGRWRVTFPFGLLHGFGFAGALRSAELARSEVPAALLSFNIGVEVGQLAVLAVVLPALAWLRRSRRFADARRALSAAVIATGALWFIARIAHAPM
jgi:hydrogenase/urease accessory protein HupE